jgi:hypothetical protein
VLHLHFPVPILISLLSCSPLGAQSYPTAQFVDLTVIANIARFNALLLTIGYRVKRFTNRHRATRISVCGTRRTRRAPPRSTAIGRIPDSGFDLTGGSPVRSLRLEWVHKRSGSASTRAEPALGQERSLKRRAPGRDQPARGAGFPRRKWARPSQIAEDECRLSVRAFLEHCGKRQATDRANGSSLRIDGAEGPLRHNGPRSGKIISAD